MDSHDQPPSAADRRGEARQPLFLECSWDRESRITDLSLRGCYVDCRRVPDPGEVVEFTTSLDDRPLALRGRVVHSKFDVGFAVEFTELDAEAAERVRAYVERTGGGAG